MNAARKLLGTPFGSALAGGLVVAAFGWVAISAGWIEASGEPAAQPPLTRPVSDGGAKGMSVNEIYNRDAEGVVHVRARGTEQVVSPFSPFPEEQRSTASGSGFVIDEDGRILTNAHVVDGADEVAVTFSDDRAVEARVIGSDPSTDIALLDVDSEGLTPLRLGDSSEVEVGDPVVAIGNPFGLDRTVTAGIVSALQREIRAPNGFSITDVLQTDAPINPGNSGGPLIDATGRVIGINSQIATDGGGGSVGIGFAVPINTAREVVRQLLSGGEVERPFLGISGADITPDLARALNLGAQRGVLVQEAFEGGPAARAGIEGGSERATIGEARIDLGGDLIVAVDGERVTEMAQIVRRVDRSEPGDELTLSVLRDGEREDVTVKLGERPDRIADGSAPGHP